MLRLLAWAIPIRRSACSTQGSCVPRHPETSRPGISAPSKFPGRLSALWGGCVHGRRGHPLQRRSAADSHYPRPMPSPFRWHPPWQGPCIRTGLSKKGRDPQPVEAVTSWTSSVAAIAKYPSPIVMVDMGTATSLSSTGGIYEGCIIMPGLALALDALSERAADLPPISIETASPVGLMGHTTEEAMRSGVLYGHASMVDGITGRIARA